MKTKINTLLILVFFIWISFNPLSAQDGLVGYFPLNGNAQDESELNIDGTMNNVTPIIGVNDSLDHAFFFNGIDANIYCGVDLRGIIDTMSVSAWIKTTSNTNDFIVSKYDYNVDRGFHFGINEGFLRLGGRNNSGEYTNTGPSSIAINDGEWHHVVGMIYENTWEIYVDCMLEQIVTSNATAPGLVNDEPLTIGNFNLENSKYFNGTIDEVRIYNKVLNTEDIDQLCKVDIVNANQEIEFDTKVALFPNPTSGWIYLNSPDFKINRIEIYNVKGAKIKEYLDPPLQIDISNLPAGMYYIYYFDESLNQFFTKPLVKVDRA